MWPGSRLNARHALSVEVGKDLCYCRFPHRKREWKNALQGKKAQEKEKEIIKKT